MSNQPFRIIRGGRRYPQCQVYLNCINKNRGCNGCIRNGRNMVKVPGRRIGYIKYFHDEYKPIFNDFNPKKYSVFDITEEHLLNR